jgi:threonine/homoserine/homoserine lactone efflux protein
MNITAYQLLLYAGGMAALWIVPGPVWVALIARSLSGGMAAAWPLAVGVALGDLVWPLTAILGLSWITSVYGDILSLLRWVAAAVFIGMGWLLLRKPAANLSADSRLTRPGALAGFTVGVAAVIGNPKAILFYMGALPGFFDLGSLGWPDILAIIAVSALIPMAGNLGLALFLDRARRLLASPEAVRRLNLVSGVLLIAVGLVIPFV